jgi:hypothetical protein
MSMHAISLRNSVCLVRWRSCIVFKYQDAARFQRFRMKRILGIPLSMLLHHALVLYIPVLNWCRKTVFGINERT